jgi:TRAP-type C4-dicarboxylate transport system permease small subunit
MRDDMDSPNASAAPPQGGRVHDGLAGNDPVGRFAGPVARGLAILCGWWLLGYCFLVVADIIGRARFGMTLQGTDEIGGYTLAVVSAIGFSHTLLAQRHTRIEVLVRILPGYAAAVLNLLAAMALAAAAVYLLLRGADVLAESLEFMSVSSSPLQVPMWLPQGLWVAGLAFFAVTSVACAGHACWLMLRDPERVNRVYGPPSLAREIAEGTARLSQDIRP